MGQICQYTLPVLLEAKYYGILERDSCAAGLQPRAAKLRQEVLGFYAISLGTDEHPDE
jgi:hypothetical protein